METVELFGETLRYDDQLSSRDQLVWEGPTIGVSIYRSLEDAAARWSLSVDGADLIHTTYGHATVAEAAQELATIFMRFSSSAAAQRIARRILAGLSSEQKGGER